MRSPFSDALMLVGLTVCLYGCDASPSEPAIVTLAPLPPVPRLEDFPRRVSVDELWTQMEMMKVRPPVGHTLEETRERREKHYELLVGLSDRLLAAETSEELRQQATVTRYQALAQLALERPPLAGLKSETWEAPRERFFQATSPEALADQPPGVAGEAVSLRVRVAEQFFLNAATDQPLWLSRYAAEVRRLAVGHFPLRKEEAQQALLKVAQLAEDFGQADEAALCYETWASAYPTDTLTPLVSATVKRVKSLGQPLDLKGKLYGGAELNLDDFHGSAVLVHLWRSDQPACLDQLRMLSQRQDLYKKRGIQLLGICLDDDERPLQQLVSRGLLRWPQVFAPRQKEELHPLSLQLGYTPLPFAMLLNPNGLVADTHLTTAELDTLLLHKE